MKYQKQAYSVNDNCDNPNKRDPTVCEVHNKITKDALQEMRGADYLCTTCDQNCTSTTASRCTLNCASSDSKESFKAKYKKIQKTVGVSSSEYAMNKASLMVFKNKRSSTDTVNSASDKLQTAVSKNTPRHANSLMRTKFSLRPGAMNPRGKGVDVKHNSYARYLARKKGQRALRAEQQTNNTDVKKQNIVAGYYVNSSGCCYDETLNESNLVPQVYIVM